MRIKTCGWKHSFSHLVLLWPTNEECMIQAALQVRSQIGLEIFRIRP